ncbi:MAG: hypothetical protein ACM3KK_00020 [Bacteroidales bacterium]
MNIFNIISSGGIRILKSRQILILTFLILLFFMGSVSAANNSSETNLVSHQINSTTNNTPHLNITKNISSKNTTSKKFNESGCCSVLLHVKDGHDVFSYRRDSNYAADLYFQHLNWYGKDAIREFKTVNGYFFHTMIAGDGWIVSTGGPDIPDLNRALENLAGSAFTSGRISSSTITSATNILARLGMGHFLIKSSNGDVGLVMYNGGSVKTALFRMGNGQYVSVPNHPAYYRSGYASISDAVSSAINLAISDRWGVNRRNIITYDIINDFMGSTSVKIWASRTRASDNIIFGGQLISGSSLPSAPYKKYIGNIALKYKQPIYFGYKSMVYMYSQILDSYHKNGALPGSGSMIPWNILSDPMAGPYLNNQVASAASIVKNYIDTHNQLPDTVTVNGKQISLYRFLYLLSFVVQNIYNKNNRGFYAPGFKAPQSDKDTMSPGKMGIVEYIHIADEVKVYMDKTGIAPGYASPTSLGTYFGWKSMIYMYSSILDYYNTKGVLPESIAVKPLAAGGAVEFSNTQVISAAITLKKYVDSNHNLPGSLSINSNQVSMYSFLYLLSTVVQNIYNYNDARVDLISFKAPQIQKEDIQAGYMSRSEYIHIADEVKVYMDKTGYVPGYASPTSLGAYFGWKSIIYMYSQILYSYNATKTLPSSTFVKPWKILSDPGAVTVTNNQVVAVSSVVKKYIDTYNQLPSTLSINGQNVSIYTYLYLVSTVVQNIYNKNNREFCAVRYQAPPSTQDTISLGTMGITQYIKIADQIKVYMDKTGITPGYAII